jgi:hypothetical protein
MTRTYKPTGRPVGRPPLPPDQRREPLFVMLLPELAAWIRSESTRLGITPGRFIESLAKNRRKS